MKAQLLFSQKDLEAADRRHCYSLWAFPKPWHVWALTPVIHLIFSKLKSKNTHSVRTVRQLVLYLRAWQLQKNRKLVRNSILLWSEKTTMLQYMHLTHITPQHMFRLAHPCVSDSRTSIYTVCARTGTTSWQWHEMLMCPGHSSVSLQQSSIIILYIFMPTNYVRVILQLITKWCSCVLENPFAFISESHQLFVVCASFTSVLLVRISWFRLNTLPSLVYSTFIHFTQREACGFCPLITFIGSMFPKGIWNRRNDASDYNYRLKKSNLLQVERKYMETQENLLIKTKI